MKTLITIIITAIATFLAIQLFNELNHQINLIENQERVDNYFNINNNDTINVGGVSYGIQ